MPVVMILWSILRDSHYVCVKPPEPCIKPISNFVSDAGSFIQLFSVCCHLQRVCKILFFYLLYLLVHTTHEFQRWLFSGWCLFPAISVYSNIFFRSGGLHFLHRKPSHILEMFFCVFPRVSDVRSLSCTFLFCSGYRGHVSICFNHGSMLLLMAEILHQQGCKCIIAWKKKQEKN